MFEFVNDLGNYESRKVSRDELENGLTVSTAYTSDEGYETAILDSDGAHPVERYDTKEEAEEGHKKWMEKAKEFNDGREITVLGGFEGIVEDYSHKIIL